MARIKITDKRGRELEGELHEFEQDGEKRYELRKVKEKRGAPYDDVREYDAVGIDPEDVPN